MKNKGFTLIELLSVIVILAIIALIATPIVMNIISDTKENADKRSADNYAKSIELAIVDAKMNGLSVKDGTYCVGTSTACEKLPQGLNMQSNGKTPTSGWIHISGGKVTSYSLNISDKAISLTNGNLSINNDIALSSLGNYELEINWLQDSEYISGVSFSYEDKFTLNYYVEKTKVNNNTNLKMIVNDKEISGVSRGNYFVFKYDQVMIYQFGEPIVAKLKDMTTNEIMQELTYDIDDYITNVIYTTTDERTKEILVALANLGIASRRVFGLSESSLINVLEQDDYNITTLTEGGQNLYDETKQSLPSLVNNPDQYMIDNNKYYNNGYLVSYLNSFMVALWFEDENAIKGNSSNSLNTDYQNYGVLVFDEQTYNKLTASSNNYDNFNINADGVVILNEILDFTKYYYITYNFNINDLTKKIYVRTYYKNNNNYYYGPLSLFTPVKNAVDFIDQYRGVANKINNYNTYICFVNFCSLLNK